MDETNKPKNFEQCCDEVAKEIYSQPEKFCVELQLKLEPEEYILLQKAAQLFREEGVREAIKLAREGWLPLTESEIIDKLNSLANSMFGNKEQVKVESQDELIIELVKFISNERYTISAQKLEEAKSKFKIERI